MNFAFIKSNFGYFSQIINVLETQEVALEDSMKTSKVQRLLYRAVLDKQSKYGKYSERMKVFKYYREFQIF